MDGVVGAPSRRVGWWRRLVRYSPSLVLVLNGLRTPSYMLID